MANTNNQYNSRGKVWIYPGASGWHFISVAKTLSAKIKSQYHDMHLGWGSLPVTMQIGQTIWQTSIFWDNKRSSYLLPLKADVRKKENILASNTISFKITIRI